MGRWCVKRGPTVPCRFRLLRSLGWNLELRRRLLTRSKNMKEARAGCGFSGTSEARSVFWARPWGSQCRGEDLWTLAVGAFCTSACGTKEDVTHLGISLRFRFRSDSQVLASRVARTAKHSCNVVFNFLRTAGSQDRSRALLAINFPVDTSMRPCQTHGSGC